MLYALVNGALVPEKDAVVSVNDRGFRFGDAIFETIRVQDGMPYLWDYHRQRLTEGLEALRIPCDCGSLLDDALRLLARNDITRGLLRIQISRGVGSQGYLPAPTVTPTVIQQTMPAPAILEARVHLWLSSREKISPRALPVRFKLAQGISSTLARMEAAEQECHDALLLNEKGHICETASANIFWKKGEGLFTPSLSTGALSGVTRRRVMELSPYKVTEGDYSLSALADADAVILTNAASGAIPVGKLLPADMEWVSDMLAHDINQMINKDIIQFTRALREVLARR